MLNLQIDEQVAVVQFDRPEKKNAFSKTMYRQFHEFMSEVKSNEQIKAVVITSTGADFCAGHDLSELHTSQNGVVDSTILSKETSALYAWKSQLGKPIISAIQGYCLGLGMVFAAMSHVCVATESAKLGLPEIRFGLAPLGIYPYLVPALGVRKTLELALTGRFIDGKEAQQMGLVHFLAAPSELEAFALEKAKAMAQNNRFATHLLLEATSQVEQEMLVSLERLAQMMLSLNYLYIDSEKKPGD